MPIYSFAGSHGVRQCIPHCGKIGYVIAIFDLIWQRFSYLKRLQMTHQEVKDEGKEAEGDPYIRARRRDRARRIANNQMMLVVPDADVVIVDAEEARAVTLETEAVVIRNRLARAFGRKTAAGAMLEKAHGEERRLTARRAEDATITRRIEPGRTLD